MADFRFGRQRQTDGMTDVQHLLACLMMEYLSLGFCIIKWGKSTYHFIFWEKCQLVLRSDSEEQ